jgi:hypothetical protein
MQKQHKKAEVTPEPQVGIFWLFKEKLIFDTTPVSKAEPYGISKTHGRGHLKHWTGLQRDGTVPPEIEYEDPPRGRVAFYPRDESFVLYADRCIRRKTNVLKKIIKTMHLPLDTKIEPDPHYRCSKCLYSNDEDD